MTRNGLAVPARAEVGDLRDALVADLRRRDRLAMEARDHLGRRELRVQDLDRHLLAQLRVRADVDRAHPTDGEQALDAVLVVEHRARRQLTRCGLHHH